MNTPNTYISKEHKDYGDLIKPYLKNWKWFVAAVLMAVLFAVLKIRYSVPEYAIRAKIQILEDQSTSSELSVFRDLDILGGGRNNVEDEIELLNSRSNLIEIVKQLGLNKKIIALGKIKNAELYDNPPFNVNLIHEKHFL
jgi:uncharacterized protein involved in exopolysaccharide biosynthesis